LILGVGLGEAGGSSGFSDPSFTHFGEPASNRVRAQMLDEALAVLTGLWSGRAFSYAGQYYEVKKLTLLPRPVQAPRIPIWVGGGWPRPGPTRRAARWDGACLYKATPASPLGDEDYTPGEIRQMRATFESQGAPPSFEIALGGRHRGSDWEAERALIAALAQAGATWWVEYLPPTIARTLPALRELVARGPLRIE
jgi:alkanesulfonate monooxygenase SsuD/methylene tetrahydromethanopterin reductase-like flavin-dependent oxidoreductase (luciferase family)